MTDGGGLYFPGTLTGGKLWPLKSRAEGREKKLAIGAYPPISIGGNAKEDISMRQWQILIVIIVVVESALLVPIAYSPYLRFDYTQTLVRWLAKAVPPETVFIGDSITAAGRSFNDYRSINLGSNGLQTYQVAENIPKALAYSPRHISIMAGTNDAGEGPLDIAELSGLWRKICAEPKVVVTKPTPTVLQVLNGRLEQIDAIISTECKGRPVIDLRRLAGKDGKILPKYTSDGVHPSEEALTIWRAELRKYGI